MGRRPTRGVVAGAVIGLLLLQAAWILTLPPFRGIDEFEHAFKAAAVARGDWSSTHESSPEGRGHLLTVPRDLVEAATPECEVLQYTTSDQCRGRPSDVPGMVRAASNAAPYNPTYYVLPGLASRLFSGVSGLYAMRVVTAIMCTVLLGLSFLALRRWNSSPWPGVALLSVFTPTFLYTTSITAPNGLEMAAAALVWSSLLGLVRTPEDAATDRVLVGVGTVGAVLLAVVRGLGPVWLLLILISVVLLDPHRALRLLRERSIQLAAAASFLATVFAGWWIMSSHVISGSGTVNATDSPWPRLPGQWVLWFLQSIAAIPFRDQALPAVVYACGLAAWGFLFVVGVRLASGWQRWAILFTLLAVTGVAIAVTVRTYAHLGTAWQGRYGYPLALGVLLLCGLVIEQRATGRWLTTRWPSILGGASLLIMTFVSQVHVLHDELAESPLAHSSAWVRPSISVLLLLDVVGTLLLAWAVSHLPRPATNLIG